MRAVSTPNPWVAASASPESLSRTRLKMAVGIKVSWLPCFKVSKLLARVKTQPPLVDFDNLKFRNLETLKGAPRHPFSVSFLFRLADRDGLALIAHLEPGKAAHADVLAQLANGGCNELRDGDRLVLDKGLLVQADLFIKLAHFTLDHFLGYVIRFPASLGLSEINIFLAGIGLGCNVFFANELRIRCRDVHGDVVH